MVDESEFVLTPGDNIAIWPEVKLGRAYAHMMELQQRMEKWEALRPVSSEATQTTDRELQITLDIKVPPPLETFATIFGDAIHNLRSALDAVVWEMAKFNGDGSATEDAERAVQFPLYDDGVKFQRWVERVGSIPVSLVQRLEAQQPYKRAAALAKLGQVDTLLMLHVFDITDKHRNSISALASVKNLEVGTIGIKGDLSKLEYVTPERMHLESGAVLMRVTSPEPFELGEFVSGPVTVHFDIPAYGGFAPILEVLGTMAGKVRTTLDGLYGQYLDGEDDGEIVTVRFDAGKVVVEKDDGSS